MGKGPTDEIPGLSGLSGSLKSVFTDLNDEGDLEVLSDGTYEPSECGCRSAGLKQDFEQLADDLSLEPDPVRKRIVTNAIRGVSGQKQASLACQNTSAESKYLAREYAKYQLSFLAGAGSQYAQAVVIHNQVA